jgi:hypothetical protein
MRSIEAQARRDYSLDVAQGHSTGRETQQEMVYRKDTLEKRAASSVSDVQRKRNGEKAAAPVVMPEKLIGEAGKWEEVKGQSSSALAYLQEEESDEEAAAFKFKEKTACISDGEDKPAEPVAFKKRKINGKIRSKAS